jgi:chromosome segregation ATPase
MTNEGQVPIPIGGARIAELARQLSRAQTAIDALHSELVGIEETLQAVDGRSQRHESMQEQAQLLRQELVRFEQRLNDEVTLRRDLSAVVERTRQRDHELESELRRALEVIARQLADFEGHQASSEVRQQLMVVGIAEREQGERSLEDRVDELERRLGAQRNTTALQVDDAGRMDSQLADLEQRVRELDGEFATGRAARERLTSEVASLRSVRDREAELLDLIDQQRATRARHESRLSEIEELVAATEQVLATAEEQRVLLAQAQAGTEERMRGFGERLEAFRMSVVDNQRLQMRADDETSRRRSEEMERELRVARDLVTRLAEQTEDVIQESPL